MGAYEYSAELQLNDGSLVQVDLEERGWAEPERLADTRVFTLVPKDISGALPFVRTHIPEGGKPVFKRRTYGTFAVANAASIDNFCAYAVGWRRGTEEVITWVMPNGAIECNTDDPTFADIILHTKSRND